MSYIDDNLLPNEKVIYRAKIHPAIFLPSILWMVSGTIFVCWANSISQDGLSILIWVIAGSAFFLTSIREFFSAVITQFTTEFGITNQRIIAKRGFISRTTLELLLTKTESVSVDQKLVGRILGYGRITVIGTGGTKESLPGIDNPLYVRRVINHVLEKLHNRT